MKKIIIFSFLIIILSSNILAFQMSYFAQGASAGLPYATQYSYIEGKNLHSQMLIQGGNLIDSNVIISHNYTFKLNLRAFERERFFNLYNLNIIVCKEIPSSWGGDYQNISINCNIDNQIPFVKTLSDEGKSIQLLFNLSDAPHSFFIKIDYTIKDFVDENGNYEIGWFKTEVNSDIQISRTLMLPSENSVIESWKNFNIITRVNGKWVLETKGNGDAMVWFTDSQKEKAKRLHRDLVIIAMTLGITFATSFIFSHKKLSGRTKHLWTLVGLSLFLGALILLFETNISWLILIGVIFLILSFILVYFAVKSGSKSNPPGTLKRQIRTLVKFIKKR